MRDNLVKTLRVLLLGIEPLLLLLMIWVFWQPSPPYRDEWIWLLGLAVPIVALRFVIYRRVWTDTPLHVWLLVFVAMTALNFVTAPYSRTDYLVLLSRPLLGIWLFIYFADFVQTHKTIKPLIIATIGLGAVLSVLALVATQWHPEKNFWLDFIITKIPTFDTHAHGDMLSNMRITYNPNEVGGALAWMSPLLLGIALLRTPDHNWRWLRISAGFFASLSLLALFLTQSRGALAGTFIAILLVIWMLLKHNRIVRYGLITMIVLPALFVVGVLFNPFGIFPRADAEWQDGLTHRDFKSLSTRFDLWQAAIDIIRDYPLTGAGMSMYRMATWVDEEYEVERFMEKGYPAPHAHNEVLQLGADFGVAGIILFAIWHYVIAQMLWYAWRNGDNLLRGLALSVFAGLLAHTIFGLNDAITLWDRFTFVWWWLVGLAGAIYIAAQQHQLAAKAQETNI